MSLSKKLSYWILHKYLAGFSNRKCLNKCFSVIKIVIIIIISYNIL